VLSAAASVLAGLVLLSWAADRFTAGVIRVAPALNVTAFYLAAVLAGFEPEDLASGLAASAHGLSQIAFSTAIGGTVFMLTAGLGVALLVAPMDVRVPVQGSVAVGVTLVAFAVVLWNDGTISRLEGGFLVALSIGLMVWLYRHSLVEHARDGRQSARKSDAWNVASLVVALAVLIAGAELIAEGAEALVKQSSFSETFVGMAVVSFAQSLEETARMVPPARRGHSELAWGNVVGTVVVLLAFNLGVIALFRPLTAAPVILQFYGPLMILCTAAVLLMMVVARRVGRAMGLLLVGFFVVYAAVTFLNRSR
jgi:cation:H+ antiporter